MVKSHVVDGKVDCSPCAAEREASARRAFERMPFDTEVFIPHRPHPFRDFERFAGHHRQGERLHGWGRK